MEGGKSVAAWSCLSRQPRTSNGRRGMGRRHPAHRACCTIIGGATDKGPGDGQSCGLLAFEAVVSKSDSASASCCATPSQPKRYRCSIEHTHTQYSPVSLPPFAISSQASNPSTAVNPKLEEDGPREDLPNRANPSHPGRHRQNLRSRAAGRADARTRMPASRIQGRTAKSHFPLF